MTSEQVSLFNTRPRRNKLVKSNYKRFDIYKLQERKEEYWIERMCLRDHKAKKHERRKT